jgi:hypothetical protein
MGGLEKGERRYGGANIIEDSLGSFNRDQMTVATEADPRRIRDRRRGRLAAANTVHLHNQQNHSWDTTSPSLLSSA